MEGGSCSVQDINSDVCDAKSLKSADYNGFRDPCEYALTITENRRGGTENHRVFNMGSLRPSAVFKGMLF